MNSETQTGRTLTAGECKAEHASRIAQISVVLSRSSGWMKLLAVVSVIGVVFSFISNLWTRGVLGGARSLWSLWYLLSLGLMVIPIWTAVLLFRAASHVSNAAVTGDDEELHHGLDRLRLYFKIGGILAVIGIVISVIVLIFAGARQLSPGTVDLLRSR